MPAMKRIILLIWALLISGALLVPVGATLASSGMKVGFELASQPGAVTVPSASPSPSTSAENTCAEDAAGNCNLNLTTPQSCVQVALPIVSGGSTCVSNDPSQGGAIIVYLREVLQLMSSAVGIVIVLMLVIAGVQYITSTGNSGLVGAAKKRIINALTALLLFMFMVLILQFIVPGGIL